MDEDAQARRRLLLLALLLLLAAGLVSMWDVPAAKFFREADFPGDLIRLVYWSEVLAHGIGILAVAAVAMTIDVTNRRYWPRVLMMALVAGLLANVGKLSVARLRPNEFWQTRDVTVDTTFVGWCPIITADTWELALDHGRQSFPSGHTATVVGLTCGLLAVYPRARWLFVALAVLAAVQRLDSGAHFPSDVLAGAALGCLSGALLVRRPRRGVF